MGAGCDGHGGVSEPKPQVQTRNEQGELRFFHTLKEAFGHADADPTVWKVSFPFQWGTERVRLVRRGNEWIYEDITTEVMKRFEQR